MDFLVAIFGLVLWPISVILVFFIFSKVQELGRDVRDLKGAIEMLQ